jgi:phosphoglycerol geranylgeranyltransferase
MKGSIYKSLLEPEKKFAVLIDPDKVNSSSLLQTVELANEAGIDYFFVGGSLLVHDTLDNCVGIIKSASDIPVVLFPGNNKQVTPAADAILLLSLISGRNPEWLIGQHVEASLRLKESKLEIIPTGYILIDGGKETSVTYVSQTRPIPSDKTDIAVSTALAGEQLGHKLIYMDAGSGANNTIPVKMIQQVKKHVKLPLIIGGGIDTPTKAVRACMAGASVVVVGNAIEKEASLIKDMAESIHQCVSSN